MSESAGYKGQLGLGKESEAGTAVEPTHFFAFSSETFGQEIERAESEGITGSRGRARLRSVQTLKRPGGGFVIEGVKAEDLPLLLELAMGNALTGGSEGSVQLAEALPSFTVEVDKVVKVFTYAGCKMGILRFSSSYSDQLLKVEAESIVAMSEAVSDPPATTGAYLNTQRPLVHRDSTLTVDSTEFDVEEVSVEIENVLDDALFRNSQTRLEVPEMDRQVSGRASVSWNSETYAALSKFTGGEAAVLSLSYTDGTRTVTFSLPQVYFTGETPKIAGREVMTLPLPFEAKDSADGAADSIEIVIT